MAREGGSGTMDWLNGRKTIDWLNGRGTVNRLLVVMLLLMMRVMMLLLMMIIGRMMSRYLRVISTIRFEPKCLRSYADKYNLCEHVAG